MMPSLAEKFFDDAPGATDVIKVVARAILAAEPMGI
jgi:hypothetical protein